MRATWGERTTRSNLLETYPFKVYEQSILHWPEWCNNQTPSLTSTLSTGRCTCQWRGVGSRTCCLRRVSLWSWTTSTAHLSNTASRSTKRRALFGSRSETRPERREGVWWSWRQNARTLGESFAPGQNLQTPTTGDTRGQTLRYSAASWRFTFHNSRIGIERMFSSFYETLIVQLRPSPPVVGRRDCRQVYIILQGLISSRNSKCCMGFLNNPAPVRICMDSARFWKGLMSDQNSSDKKSDLWKRNAEEVENQKRVITFHEVEQLTGTSPKSMSW